MMEHLIREFHQKLSYKRINEANIYDADIQRLYKSIVEGLSADYTTYRQYVPMFLSSLETNNADSIPFAIDLFMKLQEQVVQSRRYKSFDMGIMHYDADMDTVEKYRMVLEDSLSKNNTPRISETKLNLTVLSEDDKKKLASLIIEKLQEDGKQLSWSKDFVENTLLNFLVLRQVLISLGDIELFYHAAGIFFDRLSSSEYFQAARDIAEEIIIAGFKDKEPELGFFNSFRIYSNLSSIHAALMYANISLSAALAKGPPYSEKYVKEIIWQAIKLFRNVRLFPWAKEIYLSIPKELSFLDYERRALDHTFFSGQLYELDPTLPSLVLDYLNKEREAILSGGINDVLPWLLTLYNIRRLYASADFSPSALGFYLNIFETIVPPENVKKQKAIIEGQSPELKEYLKASLVNLNETRNATDFVYDNESALKISNRLVEYCIDNKDSAGFLLAMLLKSDYSILFKPKASKELSPLILPDVNIESLDILYENNDAFIKSLAFEKNTAIIWLAFAEGKLYQLTLSNEEYIYSKLSSWSYAKFKELINSNYIVDFSFDDTVKDRGTVRQLYPEEYAKQQKDVINMLSDNTIYLPPATISLCIVKDMELSKYPHNLYLDDHGELIAKKLPVTNVLSTEWLLSVRNEPPVKRNYSKSIWIPTDSGDFAISYLYGNIEDTINQSGFSIFQSIKLDQPLASDINIVCSHGGKNISEVQVVSQKTSRTEDLNAIVGHGRILIFFVCYSGSMKTEFFRNNVTSLVKNFIAKGYSAVIAPFWALDVTVPKYWLPEFLKSFNSGEALDKAVYNANMKVHEKYPTPAAWACLHLYGNPLLKKEM